jgi:hypothetical protein
MNLARSSKLRSLFRQTQGTAGLGWNPGLGFEPWRLSPNVSAMVAPRAPIGISGPVVESRAVWCSISEFSSAPAIRITTEIQVHIMKPMTAPSDP